MDETLSIDETLYNQIQHQCTMFETPGKPHPLEPPPPHNIPTPSLATGFLDFTRFLYYFLFFAGFLWNP